MHRFSLFLAAATLFLVVAGASVTSNEAGLSVPDWPLSYGKVMPEMTGGIFYEHGHRMVATTVGFLTVVLALWLWRAEPRAWLRKLGFAALGAVIAQGVLGGMTVIFLLPKPVSISHACLAQLFFSSVCAIALFTSESWKRGPEIVNPTVWAARHDRVVLLPLAVLAQLALGAAFRHKVIDLWPHAAGAAAVTGLIVAATVALLIHYPQHRALRRTALALLAITLAQVFLGVAAYMSRVHTAADPQPMPLMVLFTVAHVATGALAMAFSVLTSIQVHRHVRTAMASSAAAQVSFAQ